MFQFCEFYGYKKVGQKFFFPLFVHCWIQDYTSRVHSTDLNIAVVLLVRLEVAKIEFFRIFLFLVKCKKSDGCSAFGSECWTRCLHLGTMQTDILFLSFRRWLGRQRRRVRPCWARGPPPCLSCVSWPRPRLPPASHQTSPRTWWRPHSASSWPTRWDFVSQQRLHEVCNTFSRHKQFVSSFGSLNWIYYKKKHLLWSWNFFFRWNVRICSKNKIRLVRSFLEC